MKLNIVFATTTALGLLLATGAWADNNKATVTQTGNNNSALGQQNGTGNQIGVPNAAFVWGHITQTGDDNALTFSQTGTGNNVGTWSGTPNNNVTQHGDRNSASVTQVNRGPYSGNAVLGIDQNANSGSVTTNGLTIVQDDGGSWMQTENVVGYVTQSNDLGYVSNPADANSIDILQRGSGYAHGNALRTTSQSGHGNTQDVDQLGTRNYINTITQTGAGNGATVYMNGDQNALAVLQQVNLGGAGNVATVHLNGNQNGVGAAGSVTPIPASPWSNASVVYGGFSVGGPAAGVGIASAEVHQTGGNGNQLSYFANGDYNLYGFVQTGSGNAIAGTTSGNSHEAAVNQVGNGNVTDFVQSGTGNNLGASSTGNDNLLNITQNQSGANGNKMAVTITGDRNNNYALTANALAGDALTVASLVRTSYQNPFNQGDLWQIGSGNSLTFTVTNSNNNAFATYQNGTGNVATHSISGGNGNQAVIAQVGSFNDSATSQVGSFNVVGISQ